jgi:hypothetical protein
MHSGISQWINIVVIGVISLCLLYGLWRRSSSDLMGGLSGALGMLGTFGGIFVGLWDFNPSQLGNSIPQLLEGMKVAFLTSIAGLMSSVILKFSNLFPSKAIVDAEPIDPNINTLVIELRGIRSALVADEDSSLLSQLQKLRTTISDKNDALIQRFDKFAENMAKSNSEALITALKEVIRDFNAKINEQFGENFKHLNEAVGQLLTWQSNYKSHIERMTEALGKLLGMQAEYVAATEKSEKSLAGIALQAGTINEICVKIAPLIETLNQEQQKLSTALSEFAKLGASAKDALPTISNSLDQMTVGLKNEVVKTIQNLESVTNLQTRELEKTSKHLLETLTRYNNEMDSFLKESNKVVTQKIAEQTTAFNDRFTQQVVNLDRALQQELETSLKSLGQALGAISNKFAQDYTPLTDRLRKVVEIAERIR